jgi:hypothetical protein
MKATRSNFIPLPYLAMALLLMFFSQQTPSQARPRVAHPPILNLNFGAADTDKVGFAAVGLTENDFWNGYRFPWVASAAVSNLKWSDGASSTVGVTVDNAPGQWGNPVSDGMYQGYIYPQNGGNITVTLTNLPPGTYDFFAYGHGASNEQCGIFNLVSDSIDYGTQSTTVVGSDSWTTTTWINGQQYVRFDNVPVAEGRPVTITVRADAVGYAIINGLQIVPACLLPAPVSVDRLLNLNFGARDTDKTGFAAVGVTGDDFWNGYWFPTVAPAAVSNLKWSDGTASTIGVTVDNAYGQWGNPVTDGMFVGYIYPTESVGGAIIVTLTNLPAGIYDFYAYGHGASNEQNGIFNLVSDSIDYGTKADTAIGSVSWTSTVWQEGIQYEVIRGVSVKTGQPVTLNVLPGTSAYAIINGLQIVPTHLSPPPDANPHNHHSRRTPPKPASPPWDSRPGTLGTAPRFP